MKKIFIPILILALIGAVYLFKQSKPAETKTFSSTIMPVSFQYREGYVVLEKDDKITIMTEKDYLSILNNERVGGEGPESITIRAIDNPNNPSPLKWAEQYPPQSGYNLKTSDVTDITVSGFPAISYEAEGLYHSRNIIIGTAFRLYYVLGTYLDNNSAIYKDFDPLVASLKVK